MTPERRAGGESLLLLWQVLWKSDSFPQLMANAHSDWSYNKVFLIVLLFYFLCMFLYFMLFSPAFQPLAVTLFCYYHNKRTKKKKQLKITIMCWDAHVPEAAGDIVLLEKMAGHQKLWFFFFLNLLWSFLFNFLYPLIPDIIYYFPSFITDNLGLQ